MKSSKLGVLAAGAVLSALGTLAAQSAAAEPARACYRTHCGSSVQGHEGQCGGTVIADLKDEKSCEVAGGDWTTARDAQKYSGD